MTLTLDGIRASADGNVYPVDVLDRCSTALLLFSAAFYGRQDGVFVADAGVDATCVDVWSERLHDMAAVYPPSWEFIVDDAFGFAEATERRWDLVSVDCPTDQFERCSALVPLWCRLARRAVVLGTGHGSEVSAPEGWRVTSVVRRSDFRGGVFWTVVEA